MIERQLLDQLLLLWNGALDAVTVAVVVRKDEVFGASVVVVKGEMIIMTIVVGVVIEVVMNLVRAVNRFHRDFCLHASSRGMMFDEHHQHRGRYLSIWW